MIKERLGKGEFESPASLAKSVFYDVERFVGHLLFRKHPPQGLSPNLLNLGCGPVLYEGWVNADEYAFKRALREKSFAPDWRLDMTRPWACRDDYWDGIFTQHALEHVPYSDAAFVLSECFRTLKPGAWLRVSVPGLQPYLDFCAGGDSPAFFAGFPYRALAIAFLAQMHFHKSVWDAGLLTALLRETGFDSVREVAFGEGSDAALIKDQPEKAAESLYVEARKPPAR